MAFKFLGAALILAFSQAAFAQDAEPGRQHAIGLFLPADATGQQGFIRIINNSDRSGEVKIYGVDDAGNRRGPLTLSLEALQTLHLNSNHLEQGTTPDVRPLEGSLGDGTGSWRLLLYSALDIEPLAYMRSTLPGDLNGFLTSLHDQVRKASMNWRVSIFNPGRNNKQASKLRLINPGSESVEVTITGQDDSGAQAPGGSVRLSLGANRAMEFHARDLEEGADGLTGSLGSGVTGKWRLNVAATGPIQVMSLMESAGLLSNLSAGRAAYRGATNVWQLSFADGMGTGAGYAILAPDSRLYAWLPETGLDYVVMGTYTSGSGSVTASGKAYESGEVELNAGTGGVSGDSEDIRFSATYRSGDWIRGTYAVAGGEPRAFTGTAFTGFDRGSGVRGLMGDWNVAEGAPVPIELDIDNLQGRFSGSVEVSGFNCDYEGSFGAMNPAFDLYEGLASISCGSLIKLNDVAMVLGIRDAAANPSGGDTAIFLIILPDAEVAFGTALSRI